MIDTINPMGFDITKNLHGHVRVETRDRWTGRVVDSQEKDNLVTNAVQKLVETQAWSNAMFADVLPIYTKALGGLVLFNGTLTESATNTWFPSSAKIVGMAGQTSDTTNAIKGSLNAAESVYTSNGYTTTWDFLTSQANGTIASLARTSYRIIASAYVGNSADFLQGIDSSITPTNITYLGYDETNGYLYLALNSDVTINSITYPTSNIYRVKADFGKVSLLQYSVPPITKWTSVKTLTSNDGSASANAFVYDKYENNFIYATGTTLHIVAIDGTHTTKTLQNSGSPIYATENYYWQRTKDYIYRSEKTNLSNVQTITPSGDYHQVYPLENDMIALYGYSDRNIVRTYPYQYVYLDGTIVTVPDTAGYGGSAAWRGIGRFITDATALWYPSSSLGTIANLDSPVTKTSSQTMKITYTLTEA